MLARLIGHQRVGKEHVLPVRTQPFLLPAIDFLTRGKPGDLGGSDTRPPWLAGTVLPTRFRVLLQHIYGRRLLSFKRVSSSAGEVKSIRQFVNPDAALLGDKRPPLQPKFEAPQVVLFGCVRRGSRRTGNNPSKNHAGNAVALSCCLKSAHPDEVTFSSLQSF
jgi:hypothetical protein